MNPGGHGDIGGKGLWWALVALVFMGISGPGGPGGSGGIRCSVGLGVPGSLGALGGGPEGSGGTVVPWL